MNKMPLISVIIPTYKRPQECLRAVRSVLIQTCQDFEIIVGDDFDGDETEALLKELEDSRVHYYFNQGKGGSASKNRNLCFERARGKYITFLDSDDFMLPHKLERQSKALDVSGGTVGFAIAGTRVVKVQDGQYYRYNDLIPSASGDVSDAYFASQLSCYNTSMMVKREALLDVGGWDQISGPYDDSELLMRLALKYETVRVEAISTLWFDHDDASFSSDQVARRLGLEGFLLKHGPLLHKYPKWADSRIRELVKLLFLAGESVKLRIWLNRMSGRPRPGLILMRCASYVPGYDRLLRPLHSFLSKCKRPEWSCALPVTLEDLIPPEYVDQLKPIL